MIKATVFVGQMDKRIRFFKLENSFNTIRENKQTEVFFVEVWANKQDLKTPNSNSEVVEGKITHLQNDCFTIRYQPEIVKKGTKMLLYYGDLKYRIEHVEEVGRKKHLRIYVKNFE